MVTYIRAKTILSRYEEQDPWFGTRYSMNLYRGCQHQCIYCDTRSECYGIDNLGEIRVKENAVDLLRKELGVLRIRDTIGTGSMNDPYMPLEREAEMTRRALEVIADARYPIHVITKSDLVTRDTDLISEIAKTFALVSFTVTAANDDLSVSIEPGAPPSSMRFAAMKRLSAEGLTCGITLMPSLPFLTDSEENVREIIRRAKDSGAAYVLPAFSMTLRDRQRAYYFTKLKELFPEAWKKTSTAYRGTYEFASPNAERLSAVFHEACRTLGIAEVIPKYIPEKTPEQYGLF